MNLNVRCSDCSVTLPVEWEHESVDRPCPKCGSIRKDIQMEVVEDVGIEVHDSMKAKVKDPSLPSKKNPRVDIFAGDDIRKSDGTWMKKERVIDRDRDYYKETVIDPKTGKVIHHNEEPLSEHFGHGTAKFKKSDDA